MVIDNAGEEPLPGATIFIEELKKGIVTDGHGEFLLSDVPAATYTLTVRFIGYHTQTRYSHVGKERKKIIIRLKAEAKSLDEVVVMGKSETRKLREQAMPISVISMNQIQGTVNNVQDILAKTAGITVRATGGTGSTSRISVRGLEGKRIGLFIDGNPMNDNSDLLSTSMIFRSK